MAASHQISAAKRQEVFAYVWLMIATLTGIIVEVSNQWK